MPTRTLTIQHRETGEIGTVMDVTDYTERKIGKIRNALAYKVDFENWKLVDSGPVDDD